VRATAVAPDQSTKAETWPVKFLFQVVAEFLGWRHPELTTLDAAVSFVDLHVVRPTLIATIGL
jgi:hypothetical protein